MHQPVPVPAEVVGLWGLRGLWCFLGAVFLIDGLVRFSHSPPKGVIPIAADGLHLALRVHVLHLGELMQRIVMQPHLAAVTVGGLHAVAVGVVAVVRCIAVRGLPL